MQPNDWREKLIMGRHHIRKDWGQCALEASYWADTGCILILSMGDLESLAARCRWSTTRAAAALAGAAGAGWLAPLEWGPRGELRTALTVPEGC